ncbi:Histidine kinase-like ATPase domain-containing protein [Actinomadura meyerae]|uniref:Histidine kinase-like ATPase domain-containing protein n=2 Tax=Actinomadura meyerae TaxID=240840 RepID=A0A239P8R5_9ACTN|nr:Histidine kinase-like ATPase domain-containing protein [Actinomadura meyerae]
MRIASRALPAPRLQSPEGPSGEPGTACGDTLSVVPSPAGASGGPMALTSRNAIEVDRRDRLWRIDVPGVTPAIPFLRRWVGLVLADASVVSEAFELIVTEYGTNALWHSASGAPGGRIRAELSVSSRRTCLTVVDDGPGPGIDQEADPAEHGRGLILAEAYADETGQYDGVDGHAAWALINR